MRKLTQALVIGGLALFTAGQAQAQYYPPGYYRPPPPRADPYYSRDIGYRCNAFRPPRFGARHEICPIRDPKPIGEPCVCPPPPGYGGPWLRGRTIP